MNGKICRGRKGGGSGRGLLRYLRQYMAHEKDISPERQAEFDHELTMAAMSRDDLGIGVAWEPVMGGRRSAIIFVEGVSSFAAIEPEIDAWCGLAAKNGVKEPIIHFVYSFSPAESLILTREQKMQAAVEALYEVGLGPDHAKYLTLHEDKAHHHVHAAVAAMNSRTLLAWERNRDRFRLSHACRTIEIRHGYHKDPGLYMARPQPGGEWTIELSTIAERIARKAERQQDRLEERVRRVLGDYASFENPESWRETVVARLHEHVGAYRDAGISPFWADAHLLAAEWNGRLRQDDQGAIHLDLWERIPEDEIGTRIRIDEHGEEEVTPGLTMRPTGVSLPIASGELPKVLGEFVDFDQAENDFEQRVRADPTVVGRVLTDVEGRGMWSRADVDAFCHRRHSDVVTATELSDLVIERDKTIELVAVDASRPMYVRREQQALEKRVVDRAERMAVKDRDFDVASYERAISRFEKRCRFKLTDEQRQLVHAIASNRFAWCQGESGSGKTTCMRATKAVADELGVPIIGLATSKAAAKKLEAETGIPSYTLARAMFSARPVIAPGAWVIVDETSMSSYKALDHIGALIERQGGKKIGIGDGAQIPSLEGGSPHDVLCGVAERVGTYVELREVRRQRDGPLAYLASNPAGATEEERLGLIARTGAAIRAGDETGVERFVHELDGHSLLEQCENRDAVVRAAAAWYVADNAPTLLACKDRETVKHVNMSICDLSGLTGTGSQFRLGRTGRETRELAVGMRVQFLRNSRPGEIEGGSVANNDLGTIRGMWETWGTWRLEVDVDGVGKQPPHTIRFDPQVYNRVEIGYCITSAKSQGQEFKRAGWIWDCTSDANMAHMNASRGVEEARGFYSKLDFESTDDLAKHLGQNIVLKDDVQLLHRTIEKTGGKDTAWARNAIAAMQRLDDPLRQQYVRECQAQHDAHIACAQALRTKAEALRASADSGAERTAVAEWHTREARTLGATVKRPPSLAEWLVANKARHEREAEIIAQAQAQRERLEAAQTLRREEERQRLELTEPQQQQIRISM